MTEPKEERADLIDALIDTARPFLRDAQDALFDVLGKARVRFWTCPIRHPRDPDHPVTVEWDDDGVAHCTICGWVSTDNPESCQVCGVRYVSVYWLPDEIWEKITPKPEIPGAGLLCMECADRRATEAGLALRWTAAPLLEGDFVTEPLAEDQ